MWWFWSASQERKHSSCVDVDLASNSGSRQTKGCQPSSPRSDTVCVEAYPDTAAMWNHKIQQTCSLTDVLHSVGSTKGQMELSREIGRRRMNNLHSETDGKMQNNPKTLLYCTLPLRSASLDSESHSMWREHQHQRFHYRTATHPLSEWGKTWIMQAQSFSHNLHHWIPWNKIRFDHTLPKCVVLNDVWFAQVACQDVQTNQPSATTSGIMATVVGAACLPKEMRLLQCSFLACSCHDYMAVSLYGFLSFVSKEGRKKICTT